MAAAVRRILFGLITWSATVDVCDRNDRGKNRVSPTLFRASVTAIFHIAGGIHRRHHVIMKLHRSCAPPVNYATRRGESVRGKPRRAESIQQLIQHIAESCRAKVADAQRAESW